MNLRTLKKHCRRAVETLIEKHGYKPEDFTPADGSESIYAPPGMERQYVHGSFLDRVLPGTPLLWQKTSYEYDEWDAYLPSEFLNDLEFWSKFEPSADDLAALELT